MLRLHIPDMSCGGCAKGVTRAVQEAAPAAKIEIELSSRDLVVDGPADEAGILAALKKSGFEARRSERPA